MRIRTVKPEFGSNEGLSTLSCQAHLLGVALLPYADDEGYFNANPGLVRAGTCPLREDFQNISGLLAELSGIGYLRFGTFNGKRYGHVVKFREHQRISHPTPSKISNLPIQWEDSRETPELSGEILEDSASALDILRPEQGTGNRERNREGEARERATAPPSPHPVLLPQSAGAKGEFTAAYWLQQELGVPASSNDIALFAQAILFVSREHEGDMQRAAEFLKSKAEAAQQRGEIITVWWFKDKKWQNGRKTNPEWDDFLAKGGIRDE